MNEDQELKKFIDLCYFGWKIEVLDSGDQPDSRGQKAIDDFFKLISNRPHYNSIDLIIKNLLTGAFKYSGVLMELVLDDRGRMPVELLTLSPSVIEVYKKGSHWGWGQWQEGKLVDFTDYPTVPYAPIFTFEDHGQPLSSPFEPDTVNRVRAVIERLLAEILSLSLQAQGIQARVLFKLTEKPAPMSRKKLEIETHKKEVQRLTEAGWTAEHIAEHLGFSRKTIERTRDKLGLTTKRKKRPI